MVGEECQISGAVTASGVFKLDESLRILGAGSLAIPATRHGNSLVLNIQGDLVMDPPSAPEGSRIKGDVAGTRAVGAEIQVNATRDIILHQGARITSDLTAGSCTGGKAGTIFLAVGRNISLEKDSKVTASGGPCAGGEIALVAPAGKVEIGGLVSSESRLDGGSMPGGGPIMVVAGCNLTIGDAGIVSSRGGAAGADTVHLEGGCDVLVLGLVESYGSGQATWLHHGYRWLDRDRPGKPSQTSSSVEVWAGNTLTVDRTGGAKGQVSADTGSQGGSKGTSWIDLLAGGDISIAGGSKDAFAVHANGLAGTNDDGGTVTVLSTGGKVSARGLALQADSAKPGGDGGAVKIEAAGDVNLAGATVFARGDFIHQGGLGKGGHVAIRSFNGTVCWTDPAVPGKGAGDVRPTGEGVPAGKSGSISIQDCTVGSTDLTGVDLPFLGAAATSPLELPEACGGAPELPVYVGLPACNPGACDGLTEFCFLSAVMGELDPEGPRFPGNLGPDVVVDVELGESIQAALDLAADVNGDGFIIVGVIGRKGGLPGGHTTQNIAVGKAYPLPFALIGCGVTLHDPKPSDRYGTARVLSSASAPPDGMGSRIFVMSLHAEDSHIAGWFVEGDGRHLREVNASRNLIGIWLKGNQNISSGSRLEETAGLGIQVEGDGNKIVGADVSSNQGMGILVVGNSNIVQKNSVGDLERGNGDLGIAVSGQGNVIDGNEVFANSGDGLQVEGDGNTVQRNDLGGGGKGNGGDGLHLWGAGNLVLDNRAYSNNGDGFDVRGGTFESPNVVRKNVSGEQGKGNGGDGYFIVGSGNGSAKPIELEDNSAVGNSQAGFRVLGIGHELKKDVCEGNAGCEFDVDPGNINGTGNRIGGKNISGGNGKPFPSGCLESVR